MALKVVGEIVESRRWHDGTARFLGFWARLNCENIPVIPAWLIWKARDTAATSKKLCGWRALLIPTTLALQTTTWN
jgi:hypothetical protein